MAPLKISPETAITLSKQLGVPLEHLMHMPQHILLQKIAELSKKQDSDTPADHPETLPPEKEQQ